MSKKQLLRIGDPMLFSTLNPGFGMEKSGSGINMPDYIFESCAFFTPVSPRSRVKIIRFRDKHLDQQHCKQIKTFTYRIWNCM
jgi:hypothetical protein